MNTTRQTITYRIKVMWDVPALNDVETATFECADKDTARHYIRMMKNTHDTAYISATKVTTILEPIRFKL